MSANNADLVRSGFEAFLRGDFGALRALLDPTAQWLYWEPIPGDCHEPDKILATLRDRHREGVVTGLHEVIEGGEKVFVEISGPPQACMVVTVRDGRIVRMQDHRSRDDALFDAGLGPRPALPPPAPPEHTEPGWDQVTGLVPFVHVADVEASVAFYGLLGLPRHRDAPEKGAPTLATPGTSLESGEARIMLARATAPIDPGSQAVLFYL